jgi:glycylpeptide N-tetradecanoyltransferase
MSSAQKQKAKAEEIIDDADSVSDADSDPDEQIDPEEIASPSTSQKKKKKKRSRAAKALNALRGKQEIPQEVVDRVLDKVQAENAVGSTEATQENVREGLEQLKIMDVVKGKAGIGGTNRKDMGEHKVWHNSPWRPASQQIRLVRQVLGNAAGPTIGWVIHSMQFP